MSQTIKWIFGIYFTLIIGSYAFAYHFGTSVEDRLTSRLERIEDKLDRVLENLH